MTSQPKARLRRLNIRLSQGEYDQIASHSASTTCRSISEYCRKLLSGKPIRVFYRNKSFDDFEQRMIRIMPILQEHANTIEDLKKILTPPQTNAGIALYVTLVSNAQDKFIKLTEEIRDHLVILSDQCVQK